MKNKILYSAQLRQIFPKQGEWKSHGTFKTRQEAVICVSNLLESMSYEGRVVEVVDKTNPMEKHYWLLFRVSAYILAFAYLCGAFDA